MNVEVLKTGQDFLLLHSLFDIGYSIENIQLLQNGKNIPI